MKIKFSFNQHGVKDSINMYRNIKGVFYIQQTSDQNLFTEERKKAKEKGLKTRIIAGELFVEKRPAIN